MPPLERQKQEQVYAGEKKLKKLENERKNHNLTNAERQKSLKRQSMSILIILFCVKIQKQKR